LDPIRIACVRFLNTAPLIEGLSKLEGLELVPTVPSRIAAMVASGEADLGLCSIVDAVMSDVPLALIPAGMIGCDGPTLTVRLFSRVPWEKVTTLHADTDSHTSVALARLILSRRFGCTPAVAAFDAARREAAEQASSNPAGDVHGWPETVLLIGDKVVTSHPPDSVYSHQLDLGEEWKRLTGLPFVYAMWMCRATNLDSEPGRVRIRHAAALLDRQRRHNATRLGAIVRKHAPAAGWPLDLAEKYLGELLRFEVGPREREAIEGFFSDACALGLMPRRTALWMEIAGGTGGAAATNHQAASA
jgi:chorismate dehydratase